MTRLLLNRERDTVLDPSFDASFQPRKSNISYQPESITELGLITSLSRVFGGGAVRGFKDPEAVADVRSRSDSQSSDLRRAGVGEIVVVQIGSGENLDIRQRG